ncbi:MAG: hypothetical protein Q9181_006602, partial [Wetmoreana brouardii]
MPIESQLLGARVVVEGSSPQKAETWSTDTANQRERSRLRRIFHRKRNYSPSEPNNSSQNSVFWPKDLLAEDIPEVRILSYGYEAEIVRAFAPVGTANIFQHAQNLLAEIQRVRSEDLQRPIIFVCHSLGGVIVKEALRLSWSARYQRHLQALYETTQSVIFLGTPHRGSTWAPWGALMGNLAKLALRSPNTALLRALEVDSMALQTIAEEFSKMIREDIAVYSFREERPMTGLYGLNDKIVDDFSSIIGDAAEGKEGIDANHVDMCRFASKDDAGYRKVSGEIRQFVNSACRRGQGRNHSDAQDWPDHISPQARQKIIRDKALNLLDFAKSSVRLPIVTSLCLSVSSDYTVPATLLLGSSAFELAHMLELLPSQPNSRLLTFENVQLQQLVVDSSTYYSKISQNGLLRLICDHFHSIVGDDDNMSAKTNVGTFSFSSLESCTTVRFNARERTRTSIAPRNQDFDALQQCALGRFCRREHLHDGYSTLDPSSVRIGPPQWINSHINVIVAHSDLEHPNCLRFMTQRQYDELNFEYDFASQTLDTIFDDLEQYREAFDDYTQQGLGLVRILSRKILREPENVKVVVATARWVLGGVVRAPPRAVTPESLATNGPGQLALNLNEDPESDFANVAMRLRSGRATEQDTGSQGLNL